MAYEIPYPCRNTKPHDPHPHTAMVYSGTTSDGTTIYQPEPGMYCAGYEEAPKELPGGPDVSYHAFAGRTHVQVATGAIDPAKDVPAGWH